jgi:hypothetical protein
MKLMFQGTPWRNGVSGLLYTLNIMSGGSLRVTGKAGEAMVTQGRHFTVTVRVTMEKKPFF